MTTTNKAKEQKITKPMIVHQIKQFDEFKDKKDSALMALKKEILISTLNRLRGVDSDSKPIVDQTIIEAVKNTPKSKPNNDVAFKTVGTGMTAGMDFSGIVMATEKDLLHFSFGYES